VLSHENTVRSIGYQVIRQNTQTVSYQDGAQALAGLIGQFAPFSEQFRHHPGQTAVYCLSKHPDVPAR
jgi:hypothetical protein